MKQLTRTVYYQLDPELRLIHLFHDCRGFRAARFYEFGREYPAKTEVDMDYLDQMVVNDGYRPCHNCWKREQLFAKRDKRYPRPGFIKEPRR